MTKLPPLLATYDADEHAEQRKNLNPAFSIRALREFEGCMSENHLRCIRLLQDLFNGSSAINTDLNKWTNLLAFDVISDFAFGKQFGFLEKGYDFLDLIPAVDARLNSANAIGNLPVWIWPLMPYLPDSFWRAGGQ